MENYTGLALRYLKINKGRNRITVLGVIITTVLCTVFLNLAYCLLLYGREEARKDGDYEAVLFTQSEAQAQELLEDERIRSAYIGSYYYRDVHGIRKEQLYTNSLYINVSQPYALERQFQGLCEDYGVEGELRDEIAMYYFQGENKVEILLVTYFCLVVAYVIIIFGVGIVRNSIQLYALENIRDYGNLRCIGATNKQLKGLIYLQGAVLELIGIGIGLLFGIGISLAVAAILKWPLGFQPLILLIVVAFFMGDLYFTMGENSKMITNMSPVSAIRGEYRIKKEKITLHRSRLFAKLFGIEGDYAYKSLMRNPGRFGRTVVAMALGIAMVMTVAGIGSSINGYIRETEESCGYYQLYFINHLDVIETVEAGQASLPSAKQMEELGECREVDACRREYSAGVWLGDYDGFYNQYTEAYCELNNMDALLRNFEELKSSDGRWTDETEKEENQNRLGIFADVVLSKLCYGYNEADLKRCEAFLTDGTLDVSEQGIILINPESTQIVDTEDGYRFEKLTAMNYQVGDTIDIVDMVKLREMLEPEIQRLEAEKKEETDKIRMEGNVESNEQYTSEDALTELQYAFYCKKRYLAYTCWQQLLVSGDYKTYTIEGMISANPNTPAEDAGFILPLKQYYALTGTDESMNTGMYYHLKNGKAGTRVRELYNAIVSSLIYENRFEETCITSDYISWLEMIEEWKVTGLIAILILVFVITMAVLNFINATVSNLHLRRKEFAQLQVLGATKEELLKMTLLEGVITTIVADLIGIPIGCGISAWMYYYVTQLLQMPYYFPWKALILCILGSILLFVGSIYVPMRQMDANIIKDLTCGGD